MRLEYIEVDNTTFFEIGPSKKTDDNLSSSIFF